MAKTTLDDYDLAATTKTTKGTRGTRVDKKIAAMIAARREEMTGTKLDAMTPTWSQQAMPDDATNETTIGGAIVGTQGETTNAGALKAPEENGRPA